MRCPFCRHADSRCRRFPRGGRRPGDSTPSVVFSLRTPVHYVRNDGPRRRQAVGVTEQFSRDKVVRGVRRACQGRPVDDDALQKLAQQVEESIRATGVAEIPSHEVGLAILGPLRELDAVAYLRFASVYRSFSSIEDFEAEIKNLREAIAESESSAQQDHSD